MGLGRGTERKDLPDKGSQPARHPLGQGQGGEAPALGRLELDVSNAEHGDLASSRFLGIDGGNPPLGAP
jgi:hypothetical protein